MPTKPTKTIAPRALPNERNQNIMKTYRIVPNGADIKVGKNINKLIHLFERRFEDRKSAEYDAKEKHGLEAGQYKIVQIDPHISRMCARTEAGITKKINELSDKLWLVRFLNHLNECTGHGIQLPDGVFAAAKQVESLYPREALYGLSDYDQGKIFGQHSALLWVRGNCRSELTVEAEF